MQPRLARDLLLRDTHDARTKTARPWAVTRVGTHVLTEVDKSASVLDFGAGHGIQTLRLRESGFRDVTAFDLKIPDSASEACPTTTDTVALERRYDVVMAGNVLNVQSSDDELGETLRVMTEALSPGGKIIANFPTTPRKHPGIQSSGDLWEALKRLGFSGKRVGGGPGEPIIEIVPEAPKATVKQASNRSTKEKTMKTQQITALGQCFEFAHQMAVDWCSDAEELAAETENRHISKETIYDRLVNSTEFFRVVHGTIGNRFNPDKNQQVVHAWVEFDDMEGPTRCFDAQSSFTKPNGVPRAAFYDVHQQVTVYQAFSAIEAVRNQFERGDCPWDETLLAMMRERDARREV